MHLGGLLAHPQGQDWSVGVHLATWLTYVYLPSLEFGLQILMWDLSIYLYLKVVCHPKVHPLYGVPI